MIEPETNCFGATAHFAKTKEDEKKLCCQWRSNHHSFMHQLTPDKHAGAVPGWELVALHNTAVALLAFPQTSSMAFHCHVCLRFLFFFFAFSRLKMIQLSSRTSSTNGAIHPHESTQHCCTSRKTRRWERARQGTLFLTERRGTPHTARW